MGEWEVKRKAKVDEPAGHGTKSRSRASTNRQSRESNASHCHTGTRICGGGGAVVDASKVERQWASSRAAGMARRPERLGMSLNLWKTRPTTHYHVSPNTQASLFCDVVRCMR